MWILAIIIIGIIIYSIVVDSTIIREEEREYDSFYEEIKNNKFAYSEFDNEKNNFYYMGYDPNWYDMGGYDENGNHYLDRFDKLLHKNSKIWIIDIETTWFINAWWLIVEIWIVSLDLETWEIKIEFDSIVKEDGISIEHTKEPYWWIFLNSNLSYSEVMSSTPLELKIQEIQNIIDRFDLWVTAYNKIFDFSFLKSRWIKIKKELDCPMLVATPICNLQSINWYNEPKWPKVEEAWNFFIWTPYKESHRASDDAVHEAKIVYEMYKRWYFKI